MPRLHRRTKKGSYFGIFGLLFLLLSLGVGLMLLSSPKSLLQNAQAASVGPVSKVVTFPKAGKLRIFYYDWTSTANFHPLLFHLTGATPASVTLPGGTPINAMEYMDTNVSVTAGQQVTINSFLGANTAQPSIGWRPPSATQTCGFNGFSVVSIASMISYATTVASGQPLVSVQCWGDYSPNPNDTSTWDFNDYFVIFSYTPAAATPTPTPTSSPSPTPSPSPSPTSSPSPTPSPSPSPSPTLRPNPWDVDQNGTVNIIDIGIIIDNYGKPPALDPRTDVNNDGVVDIVDIGIVIDHYVF